MEDCWEPGLNCAAALPPMYRLILSSVNWKECEFTKSQFLLLLVLETKQEELCMSQAAEYMASSKEQATRAVASLVEKGYLERLPDPDNRTRVLIRLTAQGHAVTSKCFRDARKQSMKRMQASLTEEDRRELDEAFRTIRRIMEKLE